MRDDLGRAGTLEGEAFSQTSNMPTHSEVMAKTLAESGVKYVFGLPGGEITAFIDSCRRADIRFLLAGHESSAALMAQVMGQITGTPGVCAATLGPGATNLVTGVTNAFLDRSPLLAVVAQMPNSVFESMTHQRVALETLFAPITKRSVTVGTGDTSQLIRDCLTLASASRPGPVVLVLPSDLATQECTCSVRASEAKPKAGAASTATLSQIQERIARSRLPLVLIGLGAPPAAGVAIRKLVEILQAPFVVTPKVKGILPEGHPLFLGVATGMAIDRDIVATIRTADLVLAIGFDPVEADNTWFTEIEVVAIDSVSMAEGAYQPLEAIGDLVSLVAELTTSITEPKPWPKELLQARRQVLNRLPRTAEKGVSPLGLIEGLRSVFPRDGIVTCDVGSHKLLMGQFWRSYEPGTFFMSNGLSGMGYGIPAAIAAQLVYPDRAVMAVVGDGGMLMMIHDLVLIRELRLPVIIVVLTDRSLSLIRISQERRGYPPCGVDFTPPDFAAIAEAFGLHGKKAKSIADARGALETALSHRSSLLLEVPIDLREYDELV
jgi:acetolactate synthase-1/2/3 large subunit